MTDPGPLLAPVAACAATGDAAGLRAALAAALDAGCPAATLREALLLLAPFGGFPRTLDALAALHEELRSRGAPDLTALEDPHERSEHAARGRALFDCVYGAAAGRVLDRLLRLDPELPHWVLTDAYGRVMSRPGLSAAQRERVAIVFLCALRLHNQLAGHVRGALHCGATHDEITATLDAAERHLPAAELARARAVVARLRAGTGSAAEQH